MHLKDQMFLDSFTHLGKTAKSQTQLDFWLKNEWAIFGALEHNAEKFNSFSWLLK